MREIKFRGVRIEDGEYVYGYYMFDDDEHVITDSDGEEHEVYGDSVVQKLGVHEGREIYEGDSVTVGDMVMHYRMGVEIVGSVHL